MAGTSRGLDTYDLQPPRLRRGAGGVKPGFDGVKVEWKVAEVGVRRPRRRQLANWWWWANRTDGFKPEIQKPLGSLILESNKRWDASTKCGGW